MSAWVVVGAQWGDEGKGKIVDLLSEKADMVLRYAGGANAGHTLVVDGKKTVLHLVPSGILHGRTCIIGPGAVVDAHTLLGEVDALIADGVETETLRLAKRAHLVLPHHKEIDALREKTEGIGTTKRGIGPCYEDKVGRRGIRAGDLLDATHLAERVAHNIASWAPTMVALGGTVPNPDSLVKELLALVPRISPFLADGPALVCDALAEGKNVLVEGAQGTLLDIDHGTYPFVTSSNAIAGGACTGGGVGPTHISDVIGIAKAYVTRVGSGPFPTEMEGPVADSIRKAGAEFGATTGRPRRCGWFDVPAARRAVRINGMTAIALTKLDVLSGLSTIKVCTGYEYQGKVVIEPPFAAWDKVTPVYKEFAGFDGDLSKAKTLADLPSAARAYVTALSELIECKIAMVSVGPGRRESIGSFGVGTS